jgi:hypothetical protein
MQESLDMTIPVAVENAPSKSPPDWHSFAGYPIDSRPPARWPFLLGALLLLPLSAVELGDNSADTRTAVTAIALLLRISLTCYWFFCIYRWHRLLAEFSGRTYPIRPWRSVLFQLIPVFNYYWVFRWIGTMADLVKQRGVPMRRTLPALAVSLAAFLGLIGTNQWLGSIRLLLLFFITGYINKRLAKALPASRPRPLSRTLQLKVSAAAGIGAAFSFELVQAVRNVAQIGRKEEVHELIAIVMVSLGMLIFLEPAFAMLGTKLGASEHSHTSAMPQSWRLRCALFLVVGLTSVSHGLLHTEVEHELNTNAAAAFSALFAVFVISGVITYVWISAARESRWCATRYGGATGAVLATLLIFCVWLGVSPDQPGASPSNSSALVEQGIHLALPYMPSAVLNKLERPGTFHGSDFAQMVTPWIVFGLAGGIAIDRRWRSSQGIALAIVAVSIFSGLVLWRVYGIGWGELTSHVSAGLGWAVAMLIGSGCDLLAEC